ncbi:MAG: endonuclease/exonuclease/phosphatase family protein, partial [Phycisphaeraceae bacterium]|nr:endonuclease/exonuclease/phosphatase family protein [Phycisphaeraceae bacterium]
MPRAFICLSLVCLALMPACASATGPSEPFATPTVRIATFNTALSRDKQGQLHAALARGDDPQARLVAEVLQRTRPDIVLLQEVDFDPTGKAYADFQNNYLAQSQNGAEPIVYEHVYAPPVNTGALAPVDLDGDGQITRPNDCYGYGLFDGHYGMVVLSKHRFDKQQGDYLKNLPWQDLPGHRMPPGYYPQASLEHIRLSSKTHLAIPFSFGDKIIRLMISHPTPPVFDGPEDRNGRRNYDEIGMWLRVITPGYPGPGIGIPEPNMNPHLLGFVILGDLNADPNDGESVPGAINQLLDHAPVNGSVVPTSQGAREATRLQAGANLTHRSDPAADTADWNDDPDKGSGNLRVDYVLPSIDLDVAGSGVYWPTRNNPRAYLNAASDHKLVWIDLRLP